MLQQRTSEPVGDKGSTVTIDASEATLTFDAAGAVRGIVYHLVDEKLAREVAGDSVKRTVERLSTNKTFHPSIARSRWFGMTNPQRLEWLLKETQTITLVGSDDVVLLRARRTR